eukprot:gene28698-31864_t
MTVGHVGHSAVARREACSASSPGVLPTMRAVAANSKIKSFAQQIGSFSLIGTIQPCFSSLYPNGSVSDNPATKRAHRVRVASYYIQLAPLRSAPSIRSRQAAVQSGSSLSLGPTARDIAGAPAAICLHPPDFSSLVAHTSPNCASPSEVAPNVDKVRAEGDDAVREFTSKFDRVDLQAVCVRIEPILGPAADWTGAFDIAFNNIKAFHEAQMQTAPLVVETMPGVTCRRVTRPIGAVGLYVPGGTAVLPSTALMLTVPAKLMETPPRPDGSITPEVIYCAKKAGVTHVLKAGGAQAVAAMAWGTASCPKVDKILGPGNQYVTAAKMLLQNSEAMVAIDMPAGPSEVLVIADAAANLAFIAADLLSQAEHGPDSQVVLVALPGVDITRLQQEVDKQCEALPLNDKPLGRHWPTVMLSRWVGMGVWLGLVKQCEASPRYDTARKALAHSYAVQVPDMDAACEFSNQYAPEHLIVNVEDAESWLDKLDNAGSVFMGRWTPESVGDYASGTNHVLPTYGYARMYSGVSLDSFQKKMTVQNLTEEGLRNLGPAVAKMAEIEGLDAHKRAVTLRLESLQL